MEDITSKIYVSWSEVEILVDNLCREIKENIPWVESIKGLPRGGLIPAVMVSHQLDLPLLTNIQPRNENTVIIDDIADSGKTLEEYKGWDTAVLHYKPHTSSVIPTVYAEAFASDAWLVYPWEREDSRQVQDYIYNK